MKSKIYQIVQIFLRERGISFIGGVSEKKCKNFLMKLKKEDKKYGFSSLSRVLHNIRKLSKACLRMNSLLKNRLISLYAINKGDSLKLQKFSQTFLLD